MNINVKWMNSLKDEGIMKWLNDVMSDWMIAQCWMFKWKSTHHTEFMWFFLWSEFTVTLNSLSVVKPVGFSLTWSFLQCFVLVLLVLGQTDLRFSRGWPRAQKQYTYVSWDVESYLSSRKMSGVQWYRLDIVGTEFCLFSERQCLEILKSPLLSSTMLEFPREKYGNVCASACKGVLERILLRDS